MGKLPDGSLMSLKGSQPLSIKGIPGGDNKLLIRGLFRCHFFWEIYIQLDVFFISPQHVKRDPFKNDNILLWWNSSDIFMAALPDIGMVVLGWWEEEISFPEQWLGQSWRLKQAHLLYLICVIERSWPCIIRGLIFTLKQTRHNSVT